MAPRRAIVLVSILLVGALSAGCTQTGETALGVHEPPAARIVLLDTSAGAIMLEVDLAATPITGGNFVNLSRSGFYDGTRFHRVEGPARYPPAGFIVQAGDPNSRDEDRSRWGFGGSNATIPDEYPRNASGALVHAHDAAGVLSMANSNRPDTASSQFFLTLAPSPDLDGKNAAFGRVVAGMSVVQAIANAPVDEGAHPIADVWLYRATVLDAGVAR